MLSVYDKSAMVEVTKEFIFDSAHNLIDYDGDCVNLHGHTYKLQITIKGKLNESGMVVDFKILKNIVGKLIIDKLDHRYLNDVLQFNPTAENMVVYIFDLLNKAFAEMNLGLMSVRLWETPTSYAEYRR